MVMVQPKYTCCIFQHFNVSTFTQHLSMHFDRNERVVENGRWRYNLWTAYAKCANFLIQSKSESSSAKFSSILLRVFWLKWIFPFAKYSHHYSRISRLKVSARYCVIASEEANMRFKLFSFNVKRVNFVKISPPRYIQIRTNEKYSATRYVE